MKAIKEITVGTVEELRVDYTNLADLVELKKQEIVDCDLLIATKQETLLTLAQKKDELDKEILEKRIQIVKEAETVRSDKNDLEIKRKEVLDLMAEAEITCEKAKSAAKALLDQQIAISNAKELLNKAEIMNRRDKQDNEAELARLDAYAARLIEREKAVLDAGEVNSVKEANLQELLAQIARERNDLKSREQELLNKENVLVQKNSKVDSRLAELEALRQDLVKDRAAFLETIDTQIDVQKNLDSQAANLAARSRSLDIKEGELVQWEREITARIA